MEFKAFVWRKIDSVLKLYKWKLDAGIDSQWSSHKEYIGDSGLADVDFPLSLFSDKKNQAIGRYLSFIDELEIKDIKSMYIEEEKITETDQNREEEYKIAKEVLIKIIEKVTEIKIDKIKGKSKNKRISNIRNLYIKSLKRYTDLLNKEIADLLKIGSSTVTNVLGGRYKENDFILKSIAEIDKNVNL